MASEEDKHLIENLSPMRRYRNLFIAIAAIASIFLVTWTGIDKGLIDNVLHETVEVITVDEQEVPDPVPAPADPAPYEHSGSYGSDSPVNLSEEHR